MKIVSLVRLTVVVIGLCLSSSAFGYVYDGYDYLLTTNAYAPTANWAEAAVSEFGPAAQVVDWNTIKAKFGGSVDSLRSFLDGLGVTDVYNAPAVTWNGSQTWPGTTRSYGINRAEGIVPPGYLIHDQILNNWLLLGSWPADRQLVVSIPVQEPLAEVYDLKSDWSETSNPNGVWSYNTGETPLPHQNQVAGADWGPAAQPGWSPSSGPFLPFWFKATNGNPTVTEDWLVGDIITHSQDEWNGQGMGPSNVTFTCPHAGIADISGSVWITRDVGRSVDWALYINNVLITNGNVQSGDPYNRANPFNLAMGSGGANVLEDISFQSGDVLKLQFTTVASSFGGDLVGVNLTVSFNTQPPTAVMFGPASYLSFADSPFYNNTQFSYFYLEDFVDGNLNTPGVTATGIIAVPGPHWEADSVDGDDGQIDGNGNSGGEAYTESNTTATFTFDKDVLGHLPNHVGLVWTDIGWGGGFYGNVTFEVFDENGIMVGKVGPAGVGDGSDAGGTAEDRFFGAIYENGIKTLVMSMGSIDWECDHLQYGYQPINTLARFGTFDGKKNVKLKLKDCDGNDVTLSLTGGGYGEVDPCDCAFSNITLYNTTDKSKLTISTKSKVYTNIGNIICSGPLKSINAKTTTFDGSITIGPSSNPKAAVAITFDFSRDLTIDSAVPVKSIKAVEFVNSTLVAPSLGSITTKGDKKRNMMGLMNVDVNVPGPVGSVKAAGELSGEWDCNTIKSISALRFINSTLNLSMSPDAEGKIFALNKLTVKEYIGQTKILSAGNIGTVKAGIMIDSSCFAGVDFGSLNDLNTDDVLDLPAAEAASFPQTATIKSIAIKGIKNKAPFYWPYYFINSNIAAANILSVSIKYPKSENWGIPFGLTADYIKKLTIKNMDDIVTSQNELQESVSSQTIDGVEIRLY